MGRTKEEIRGCTGEHKRKKTDRREAQPDKGKGPTISERSYTRSHTGSTYSWGSLFPSYGSTHRSDSTPQGLNRQENHRTNRHRHSGLKSPSIMHKIFRRLDKIDNDLVV